jgi:hypothetical protein
LQKKNLPSALSSIATKYVKIPVTDQAKELYHVAKEKQCNILVTKWLTRKRLTQLNIHNSRNDQWVLTIRDIGHGVSIVGDLLFDSSTQMHALKFCKEALDW